MKLESLKKILSTALKDKPEILELVLVMLDEYDNNKIPSQKMPYPPFFGKEDIEYDYRDLPNLETKKVPYGQLCGCNPAKGGSGICGCTMGNILVDNNPLKTNFYTITNTGIISKNRDDNEVY